MATELDEAARWRRGFFALKRKLDALDPAAAPLTGAIDQWRIRRAWAIYHIRDGTPETVRRRWRVFSDAAHNAIQAAPRDIAWRYRVEAELELFNALLEEDE
jgi:hypothetical protein